MRIMTARFGEVDIDPADIITLVDGIIGFPVYKRFVFLPFMEGTPFELFQAVDQGNLAFICINPFLFYPEYSFDISDADQEALQVASRDDIEVRVIVTMPEDPRLMTANLQGPLLVNRKRLLGKQVILHESNYDTKYSILGD